ncbi:MAG: Gfo/Idh/MocA family oxidoreductase [Deltaproteobacteria bacterium]|nr:Gfo/Idh/MocA family oxidoreductase [Deltaproteobacteria bacterium]
MSSYHSEIGLALVGAGYWGTNLARTFTATPGIALKVVCDRRRAALQEIQKRYTGVEVTDSWNSVVGSSEIDAVVLATPPSTHYRLAREALSAGKHTWVEKPLALRYEEGRGLVEAARKAKRMLFVDETFLYDALVERARELIATGSIGKLYHASFERTGMGRIRRDSNVWWNSAPHDLSVLRHVLNLPVLRMSVFGHARVQRGIEDVVWAALELGENVSLHLYLSWLFPDKRARMTIVGETGIIEYEGRFEKRALRRYNYKLGKITSETPEEISSANLIPIESFEVTETIQDDRREPLLVSCAAFRDSILSGLPAPSSGERSLATVAALEAGDHSLAQNGLWVQIPQD